MCEDKYLMSSLYNALEILDLLSEHNELGVMEISKELNMGKSSVFKMLYTLEKKGYVHKSQDAKYKLGVKFIDYGLTILQKQNVYDIAKPYIKELRDRHNETTHLGVIDDDLNMYFVLKESSTASIQMASVIGKRMSFHTSAIGKTIVSNNLDEEIKNKIKSYELTSFTKNTIVDYDELINHLIKIKEQGYGEDLEEYEIGLTCYAVPVKDISGKAIAAISISGPTQRMTMKKESLLSSLKIAAKDISKNLGYKD